MEMLLKNILILCGVLFIIDFVASYPWLIKKADVAIDKATVTVMGEKSAE